MKKLQWVGSCRKELKKLPEDVCDAFGSALLDAQYGDLPEGSRPFGEGLPTDIIKLVEYHDGNTYRLAYTVEFPGVVYALDAFQKKSKSGKATPEPDKARVLSRYKDARKHYEEYYRK